MGSSGKEESAGEVGTFLREIGQGAILRVDGIGAPPLDGTEMSELLTGRAMGPKAMQQLRNLLPSTTSLLAWISLLSVRSPLPGPTRMEKVLAQRWGAAQLLSDFTALPSELTSLFPTRQRGSWRKRPTPQSCALKVGTETPKYCLTGAVLVHRTRSDGRSLVFEQL